MKAQGLQAHVGDHQNSIDTTVPLDQDLLCSSCEIPTDELKTQTIVEHFLPAWPAPLLLAIKSRHQADDKLRRWLASKSSTAPSQSTTLTQELVLPKFALNLGPPPRLRHNQLTIGSLLLRQRKGRSKHTIAFPGEDKFAAGSRHLRKTI